jgi:hypothetical protein
MQQEELIRKELLAEVESIASLVGEHAEASEALGRLDEATMAALRSTRLLQYLAPRELGGLEADPVTQLLDSWGPGLRIFVSESELFKQLGAG